MKWHRVILYSAVMALANIINGFIFSYFGLIDKQSGYRGFVMVALMDLISIIIAIIIFTIFYMELLGKYIANFLAVYFISEVSCILITYIMVGEIYISYYYAFDLIEVAVAIVISILLGRKITVGNN